ncbi:disco-interacting protein 2 homolog C-like [Pundamilia nyererei]|uniref:Disco-interacting protein 2 homolog C-like n=1 Tax=Pundamilia nyererei TaxID=303518 RepID=A0A9Y6MBJ9_9CICH|nr:PREDICTED: disco-interacting protein 2 homolog C-like [Pundamilia nyererei]
MADRDPVPLPAEVRAKLAELELELSEGDITQKGYEKKRSKLIGAYLPQAPGMDPSMGQERRTPVTPSSSSRYHRRRSSGSRDERYRSDVHTEAVQAALAKHKERKMAVPMPSKRRSLVVQSSMDAYTPPDTSSGSEGEGQGDGDEEEGGEGEEEDGGGGGGTSSSQEGSISMEHWISRAIHGTSSTTTTTTSSTASSSSSSTRSGGSGAAAGRLADVLAQHVHISSSHHHRHHHRHHHHSKENHSAPPDVTGYTNNTANTTATDAIQVERAPGAGTAAQRQTPKYGNAELMETGDGVPVSSRVSAKIQQLVNTLKRPKRPPLREFFVDDFEELLEVQQPDPNQPKAEGAQMVPMRGEQLGVVTNWPPSLEAALQRWGTISPKAPCLTTMDTNGKPLYVLTYGKLWSRSVKVAYNLLHKLGTKQEPLVRPGDRVALVFPNNDPASFMTAFYGCLLAEVVPVPIEVPLTRKDAGSQQIGFLLGSCGVTVALTSDACHKGLPKSPTGEIPQFKGWPKVMWFVMESKHLSKPPRDWFPHIKEANQDTAYIEYKTCKDGSVLGVTVMRIAMLTHCQAITQSCSYTEAETIVNVLDFKKDVGLWHAIQTSVMNMMHVISIPYALMKVNPLSWIQKVCQYKAKVACVKSRDMHWALVAHRDQRDVNLSSLRMLVVADGSNPWSISSCDAFLNVFQTKGLKPEVICPCASSPEALTVAIRRPLEEGTTPPGRGILSMQGLSHGVIRVDSEEKLSVLTLQDVGSVMPGGLMCVVKLEGVPQLCKTDEIGEMCVCTVATGTSYYGLAGMTKNTFEVFPVSNNGTPISEFPFTRTGLLGFIGPAGLIFVAGKMDGLMVVGGRRHNADDIVATALAVEPMKFVYRGRIAVFSITVLHDERIVVVAEQRPDSTEEDSFQWMSRVLQAIDGIHQVGVYCLALVPSNTLPKTPLGGIHLSETKQLFLEGALHPCNVLMCPHTCVTNLPKPRQKQPEIGPASVMVGNLVSGKRIAQASGRDLGQIEDNDQARKFLFLTNLGCFKMRNEGRGIDLIVAFYGCLYAGCVPITVRPPHPQNIATTLPTVKMIVEVNQLCDGSNHYSVVKVFEKNVNDNVGASHRPLYTSLPVFLMSHTATSAFCRSIKLQCELYPSREVAICLDPYCGLGFVLWCLCSVYSGHQSILIPPSELEVNPALWLSAVSQYKVRDTFCSYSVMELCTKGLGLQTDSLKARGLDLSRVRTCVVVAEERPRIALTQSFSKLFKDLGLHPRAVSTSFGCRVNLAICLQGTSGPDPTTVYVDMRALRHDRVRLVERGSPHSLPLMESGKILPGVRIIIANPETKGPMGESHLGEIWVHSGHNASGYFTVYGDEALQSDHFNSRLSFGDTQTVWARTGYLGFLRRTELTDASGERHDALYVVGALEEAMELRGMRYHPIDIETSVIRTHKSITECAVFTWTNLLVVVVELDGSEQEALDLVPLVTNVVLEEHYLIVGVVVVVDIGVIPINSRGEKQRMHLRDGFLADQLDPIYVAYNM